MLLGLVLIPYPGPGWLIVIAGFALLATEFEFAEKVLQWLRAKLHTWQQWVRQQPKIVQVIILLATMALVLATLWLLDTFGLIDHLLHLHIAWLHSPVLNR